MHKTQLDSLEAALKSADQESRKGALTNILEKYPFLYGYWLTYLQEYHANDKDAWLSALHKCPSLELYQQFFTVFPGTVKDFELAIEQVGHYFQAAPIWDKYLLSEDVNRAEILRKAISMPLYDYAKYFQQAHNILTDLDLTALGAQMAEKIGERWAYESKIQRPYFHVLPLEQSELDNWNNYLDFQEIQGDVAAGLSLYRRCLISTALYAPFWMRYLRFVGRFEPKLLDTVTQQAMLYLEKSQPEHKEFQILYASYLEVNGRDEDAKSVLTNLGDFKALEDYEARHNTSFNLAGPTKLSAKEARELWDSKQLDKHKYLEALKANGELEEFFKMDIIFNGPPDAVKAMKQRVC